MTGSIGAGGCLLHCCCALTVLVPVLAANVAQARTESVVYSFQDNGADGGGPIGNLIDVHGTLYGATAIGGAGGCVGDEGCGTVFSLDPKTGAEKVLYSFQNNREDGSLPQAGVINVRGTLYGTTLLGGAYGNGTVFAVDSSTGAETVLHSFDQNGKDGVSAVASLIEYRGLLYGTTANGGAYEGGTLYSVDPSTGEELVLHSFGNDNGDDGAGPRAGLINVQGVLYGTTLGGGDAERGTVYSFDPSTGTEKLVYSFCVQRLCADGAGPAANLTDVDGVLYGTTSEGGSEANCGGATTGCGVVFSVDPGAGAESVLYKFQNNGADGIAPSAGLIDLQGMLYGTTASGGGHGLGTVYAVNPGTGAESVLHSFRNNGLDGENPSGDLLRRGNKLYGNALGGGTQDWGAVFKINPGI